MRHSRTLPARWVARGLMAASGFAALGYQIVWAQQCGSWLGHESAGVLAVLAAFFGGLAVGGLTLGSRIEQSRHPVRWYAACELAIALWSMLLLFVLLPFSAWVMRTTGTQPSAGFQWSLAFCSTFLLFLPATAAMGATLPAMERLSTLLSREKRSIAPLYASNTCGAVLGVLASAFLLIPAIGLTRTAAVCIALNLSCGVSALWVFREVSGTPDSRSKPPDWRRAGTTLARLAITGLLGIGYEVVVVRVLSQVTEDTVYTFALLLAVYLAGSAGGAAAYQRWLRRRRDHEALGGRLLAALATACLFGTISLWAAEQVRACALEALGASMPAALAAEALLALLAFGPPTIVMGAVFSHLSLTASSLGLSFGAALGVNTLAAAAAPLAFGVLAVPALGPKAALLLIAAGYLVLIAPRAWLKSGMWLPSAGALAVAFLAPPLRFVEVPEGGRLVSFEEGVMAAVSVVEDETGVRRLRINNRQQEGSNATRRVDARQAWLPLLLHPEPHRVLFLGLGTGVTASSAAEDPTLEVDAVELLPEVIAASQSFAAEPGQAHPRLHVLAADARRYARSSERHYDVIVSDNFHPARSGSGALYTVEHFAAVRRRLAAAGVFCQWLPLHQLDLDTLRSIVRSYLRVYPQAWAIIANNSLETPVIGLVARNDSSRFDVRSLNARLAQQALSEQRAELGLEDELAVLGSVIAGPPSLLRFAGNTPANTDDRPLVAYRAPRLTYAPDSSPRDRLLALLHELSVQPDQLIAPATDPAWARRLTAYWAARDRFIASGRDVQPASRVEDMLAQVREPLLSTLRISPDFRPAYDPLVSMATALAGSNVSDARALLVELTRIQPARSEAARLLARIGDETATNDGARLRAP